MAGNWAADFGGGLYGNLILHNTIVWGNLADSGDPQMCTSGATLYDSVVQGGCPTNATCVNVLSADPRLGALGDYGGSTPTMPLRPGSAALDAGNDATCLLTDQRGVTRPQVAHCDIGAFESHGFILSVSGGDQQTTRIKTAFPNALVVSIVGRNIADPVENGVVTFNAPASGAGATPLTSILPIMGNVAAQGLTANGITGAFTVTVAASGVLTPATFVLTNTNKYAAAVALASMPNPSGYGQTVFLTATVSAPDPGGDTPTGTVAFTADGSAIAGCAAQPLDSSGQAACATAALASGMHSLRADYGGDGNYSPGASPTHIQVVIPVNHAPVAVSDIYTTPQDTALVIPAPGVLDNDSDPDGDLLTAALVTQPMHGKAGLNSSGALLYLPAAGFVGQDAFDYAASDGVLTATARITVNVTRVNHPVVARDDIAVTREDETLVVPAPGVLANDADPDGDPLTAELLTLPFTGTVTLAANGAYTYTPPLNFNDVVSFTYRVHDTGSLSATATVYILVQAVNDPPTFTSQPGLAAMQEQPYTYTVIAADPDLRQGDTLILTAVTLPTWLTLSDSGGGAGELGGIPSQADVGNHTVILRVTDRAGAFTEQAFVITVTRKSSYDIYLPLAIKNGS